MANAPRDENRVTTLLGASSIDGKTPTVVYADPSTNRLFTNVSSEIHAGMPQVISQNYLQSLAEGDIPGHTPWSKIGYTPAMTTTESDIWNAGGAYVFPTAAMQMEVVSSNNTDDIGTVIKSGTSTGGSTTTLIDSGANFTGATAVQVGDCVILDKSGTIPEFGYVTSVDSATQLTVGGGFYKGGSGSGRAYQVIDFSATLGAHVVKFEYLDGSYNPKEEFVILNGTTVVPTVNTDIFRINSFRVIAAGGNYKPTGNLSIRNIADTPIYSYIQAGYTRARNSIYTVQAGKSLYVTSLLFSYATTGNANKEYARLTTRANVDPTNKFITDGLFNAFTDCVMQNTSIPIPLEMPTLLPEKTDIRVSGTATATGVATVAMRGWLE